MKTYILHYREALGRRGAMFGELILTDGKTLSVWTPELHEKVMRFKEQRIVPVEYKARKSAKGNWYLTEIDQDGSYDAAYDAARGADELQRRSHKQGGFIAQQIKKNVQTIVEAEKQAEAGKVA